MLTAVLLLLSSEPGTMEDQRAKLRANIRTIVPQIEGRSKWSKADREDAMTMAEAAIVIWADCVGTARARFARSREPADTIATASLGSCIDDEGWARRAVLISYGDLVSSSERNARADKAITGTRQKFRESVIAAVLKARTNQGPKKGRR